MMLVGILPAACYKLRRPRRRRSRAGQDRQDRVLVARCGLLDHGHLRCARAAAAVREFTDDELDRATPFSLSYGAPVTAQFVIEDHALQHSWHHLARIRSALGS